MIYREKNGGHREFKRVKSLPSSQSDCLFALSRHCVTFPTGPGSTAILQCHMLSRSILVDNVCTFGIDLPSWSAMHDVCVTCAKKCVLAMAANVLKHCYIWAALVEGID